MRPLLLTLSACAALVSASLAPSAIAASPPQFLRAWGTAGSGIGQFFFAHHLAVSDAGDVYVGDLLNQRVQKFTADGAFVTLWNGGHEMDGVALAPDGSVYVSGGNQVSHYTSAGGFLSAWGSSGTADGQFQSPLDVAVDADGFVYVADWLNHRIQKFTSTGAFVTKWGSEGTGDGQFATPLGIAVEPGGTLLVADVGTSRIQRFTSSGTFVAAWGTPGAGPGQLSGAGRPCVDPNGFIVVPDQGNNRIEVFRHDGAFVTEWGSAGTAPGQFNHPTCVGVDGTGDLYVMDKDNARVQKFAALAPLEAAVALAPEVINLKSHAPWVTAYVEPADFDVTEMDVSTIRLAGSAPAAAKFATVGDHDADGAPDLMVKFGRAALAPLLTLGPNTLELTGRLWTGERFAGAASVTAIDPPGALPSARISPNPINPSGILTFVTTRSGLVSITLYDPAGRLVRTLIQGRPFAAGVHDVPIDGHGDRGEGLSSGVYFYRVDAAGEPLTGRVVVLK